MIRISIIIPTLNRLDFLKRAMNSVLPQSLRDYEILVIQNGMQEISKAYIQELMRQGMPIRYFYEPNPSAVHARNVGIENATAEFIAFLDDDDEWMPGKLAKQVEILDSEPGVGLVACRGIALYENGKSHEIPVEFDGQGLTYHDLIEKGCVIHSLSSVMVRRECFDSVGLFREKYLIGNDFDFYLRLAPKYGMIIISDPLFIYHRHGKAFSHRKVEVMWSELVQILRQQSKSNELSANRAMIRNSIKRYGKRFHKLAVEARHHHDYLNAARFYLKAIQCDPSIVKTVRWSRFPKALFRMIRTNVTFKR